MVPQFERPETRNDGRPGDAYSLSGALGYEGNTHTRRNQCECYAGLGRNHGVLVQLSTASCPAGPMQIHPKA